MKRVGGLWETVTSLENLFAAAKKAARGKRAKGKVSEFLMNLEPEVLRLRRELVSGEYRPGGYVHFEVRDPKPRKISAAPFRDRVVHHALTGILEPVFERRFSDNSYACRVGKGTHAALAAAREGVRRYRYCLKCDVRKYFASVDHGMLLGQLERVLKCRETLALCGAVLEGFVQEEEWLRYFAGDDLFSPLERRRGLPLGNQTSQFFANVYLNAFDQWMDREVKPGGYARYVDDWVVFGDCKEKLAEVSERSGEKLALLRLTAHPGKTRVHQCAEGVSFLGWRLDPWRMRLARVNVVAAQRRLRELERSHRRGEIGWEAVKSSVMGWVAHARQGDTHVLRSNLLSRYRFRLADGVSAG
jgi:retron-type reverse transcriptase